MMYACQCMIHEYMVHDVCMSVHDNEYMVYDVCMSVHGT